ncbi:MAG TPA: hypothetical protein RMG48_09385 [Myxococcales bacterium LLY-WYZ-16_1]|nr:hypothetical protein [Myxococcales bacterium LLY-WYZ-16_1]
MANRAKKTTTKRKTATKKSASSSKNGRVRGRAGVAAKPAPKRVGTKKNSGVPGSKALKPRANKAVKEAADALWGVGVPPHTLLQELHEVLLLRCLEEADGNYAAAASLFGPSRQSVQQYANSSLRDERWRPYQQNRRRTRV